MFTALLSASLGNRLLLLLLALYLVFLLHAFQFLQFLFGQIHLFFLAMTASESQFFHRIFQNLFLVILVHNHLHQLAQHINAVYLTPQAVLGGHVISDIGESAV